MGILDIFRNRYSNALLGTLNVAPAGGATAGKLPQSLPVPDPIIEAYSPPPTTYTTLDATPPADTISPIKRLLPAQTLEDIKTTGTPFGLLKEGMLGITRAPDGVLEVSYTFEHTERVAEYETPEKTAEGYEDSRPLNTMERQAIHEAMRLVAEETGIRFVPATDPEQAYLPCWHFSMGSVFNHSSGKKGVGGQCGFPDEKGVLLLMGDSGSFEKAVRVAVHEIGHGIGERHTFEDWDLPDHLRGFGFSAMQYYGKGDAAGQVGAELYVPVTTPQLGDIRYMQNHYGPAPLREPKLHTADLDSSIARTFLIMPDDTLRVFSSNPNVVNPNGGVENITFAENRGRLWTTRSPRNLMVGGEGRHFIVQSRDSSNLSIEGGDADVFASRESRINLGPGTEKVIFPMEGGRLHISDFNPATDSLLYGDHITRREIDSDGGNGSRITFYAGSSPAGTLTVENVPPESFSALGPISEAAQVRMVNDHRDHIQIREGDNGVIHGYRKYQHSLQFNTGDQTSFVSSAIDYRDGAARISLRDYTGTVAATFTLPDPPAPEIIQLYSNGREVPIHETNYTSPDGSQWWTMEDGWPLKLVDVRKSNAPWNSSVSRNSLVRASRYTTNVVMYRGCTGGHVHIPSRNKGFILYPLHEGIISVNKFRTKKDKIECVADSITAWQSSNGTVSLILDGKNILSGENMRTYVTINDFKGKLEDLKVTNYSKGGVIPVKEMHSHELSASQINHLLANAQFASEQDAEIHKRFSKKVPDIRREQPKPPAPPPTPARKSGGGRGR